MNCRPLRPHRPAPGRRLARPLLAALPLLAGLNLLLTADVIDDFNNGRKFIMHGGDDNAGWQIVEGQLHVSYAKPESFSGLYYLRNYAMREGVPIEFRMDLLSLAPGDGYAGLMAGFAGAPFLPRGGDRGYILYRQHTGFLLYRAWDDGGSMYFEQAAPPLSEPETMSLILTRVGTTMRIQTRVVLRDNAGTVLLMREVTDRNPPQTPVSYELISSGSISNPSSAVLDNLTCSVNATPLQASIRRHGDTEMAVAWSGLSIPVEAPSLAGPWTPCAAALTQDPTERCAAMPCDGAARFFRVVPGRHVLELFTDTSGNWATASLIAGRVFKPNLSITGGRCRIRGSGLANEDFVMRYGADVGLWYTDCAASVDILDWDDAMVGASFGIYLRVKSEQDLWFVATEGLPPEHYGGMLTFRRSATDPTSVITILGPGDTTLANKSLPLLDPDKQYRLRFCAVGKQLTLALFDLADLSTPLAVCEKLDSRIPKGLSALGGRRARGEREFYDVTIDRFLLNGVAP
ncbi:MAG: hypothetical protein M5U12_02595 [Verrucomicrobia bacterium]|nr:hypothetical protein [Verrucomicrobiota bacterium]